MPKYQYRCADCGSELEVQQKFTDDALTVCPGCEGRLNKVYSAVGVVFKGSGFYKTDSRASRSTSAGSSSSGSEASSTTATSDSSSSGSSGSGASGSGASSSTTTSGSSTPAS